MKVIKNSGEKENFNSRKIYNTILSAGGSRKIAKETINLVKKKFTKEAKTKEILEYILNNLKKKPGLAQKYNLKRAIMDLGPTGFPFEQFFAKILENYGYSTKTDQKLKGKNIIQEVDIVAKKDKKYMVECKYHNDLGTITRLHPAMYTYARFLDLKKYSFDFPWLVTNTRCSEDAIKYAKGVKLKITSWNHPKNESLQKLIQNKNLYPLTILLDVDNKTKRALFDSGFIVLKDFEGKNINEIQRRTRLPSNKIKILLKELEEIINKKH